jgi:hypothetical protein
MVLTCAGEFALSGLFGMLPMNAKDDKGEPLRVQGSVPPLTWNALSQVFPAEGLLQLFEQYKASFLQGGPHVFSASYKVGTLHGLIHACQRRTQGASLQHNAMSSAKVVASNL